MKKGFIKYTLLWLVALAIFNAVTFLTPNEIDGVSKFTTPFWIAYAFITIAFFAQLFCTALVFKKDLLTKKFCNMPLTAISVISLTLLVIAGSIFMAMALTAWIAIIVCYVIVITQYIINIVALVTYNDKGASAKGFVAALKAKTDAISQKAINDELKALTAEVCEAVRSADTFSDAALAGVEDKILKKCEEFEASVASGDMENAKAQTKQLLTFIKERNAKCRILK